MSGIARKGLCLILAAPSGAGKSTLTRALVAADPLLSLSVSVTTRAPRPGEQDGLHYHFRDQAAFDAMVARDEFLEWAKVLGRDCYGTLRAPVETTLAAGRDVAFDVDWQGHLALRAALPCDVVGVFVLPPSLDALEARLRRRGGESEAEVARRMSQARDEISHWVEFDHVVMNDVFDDTLTELMAILKAARRSTKRQIGLAAFVASLVEVTKT
jgi:guanylate kinase